ncbi:hypothetical protein BDN67DRAFT_981454 [Paxillus ammoniavirescens]|nr:hypothetical protein BDN67DRAFT_981454 [Paxillus ammoniavirescens]
MVEKGIQLEGGRKCNNIKYLYSCKRKVHVKIQSTNLELVTMINLKPGFVFSGKDVLQEEHFEEDGLLHRVALSPKGWTSDFIGQEWFEKSFVPQAKSIIAGLAAVVCYHDGAECSEEDINPEGFNLEGFDWEVYAMDLEQEAGKGSASRALSQSATPLAIAHDELKLAAERLREAEDKVRELEEENKLLKNVNGVAETHCYFAGKMVAHLQWKLNSKETNKGKRHYVKKVNTSACILTLEKGRAELQQLREQEELKEQKEAEVKVKKVVEEQAQQERRADHSCLFMGTLNKTKKKDKLEDLVAVLALPELAKRTTSSTESLVILISSCN